MSSWKKNIKNVFFDRLKKEGYGFDTVKYSIGRKFKINLFLKRGLLGVTQTPILKNGKKLQLDIYYDKIDIFEISESGVKPLKEIHDWQDKIGLTIFYIGNIYDEYFYSVSELKFLLSNRKDYKQLDILINSAYPELKVRSVIIQTNTTYLWFGSGIFSFQIEKNNEHKKIMITTLFYGSGARTYQYNNQYCLAKKYRDIIRTKINTTVIYNNDLTNYKNIYLKTLKM